MLRKNTESRPKTSGQDLSGKKRLDILSSRLGRKMVYRFIFVGLVPLIIFSFPLYYQTTSLLNASVRSTLIGYSKLANSALFSTLEKAQSRVERLALYSDNDPSFKVESSMFRKVFKLNDKFEAEDTKSLPWNKLDPERLLFLKKGRVIITAPYLTNSGVTLSLIAPMRSGYIACEMEPVELWDLTRAGLYGQHGILLILDEDGRILATSGGGFEPFQKIWQKLPQKQQMSGEDFFPGIGKTLWGYNEIWLEGAFGGERWGLIVAQTEEGVFELPVILVKSLLVLMGAAFCVIVLLSYSYVRYILAPILELVSATKKVSNNLSVSITAKSDDELGDLIKAFNDMTVKIRESREESIRLTSKAMLGRMAAMVAHRINTPLAAMKTKIEMIEKRIPSEAKSLNILGEQVRRINETVRALLGFARMRSKSENRCNILATVNNVEALFSESFSASGVGLEINLPGEEIVLNCAPEDIQEILVNLLENARDSSITAGSREDGLKRITKMNISRKNGEVEIVVEDEGIGLKAEPETIFEPFSSSKVYGTGLGLAICRRICRGYGGDITAENRAEGGARFIVRLPYESEIPMNRSVKSEE